MLIVLCPNISPNWCIRNLCPEGNQRAEDLRTLEENSTPRAIGSQPTVRNEIIWRGLKNNKAGSHPRSLIYYSEMLHGACNRFPGNSNVQSRSRSTAVGALNCWLGNQYVPNHILAFTSPVATLSTKEPLLSDLLVTAMILL